jgi:indole-3-glycerol phosphate synthase
MVSESGIKSYADVQRLEAAGVDAILVGESLMREADIGAAVDLLLNRRR